MDGSETYATTTIQLLLASQQIYPTLTMDVQMLNN